MSESSHVEVRVWQELMRRATEAEKRAEKRRAAEGDTERERPRHNGPPFIEDWADPEEEGEF